jgi:serine/threonine-protein kinase
MLFHLLTGERPYEGSMTTIMQKVLNAEVAPKPSSRPGVPPVFDAVVATAMARAPAARFPSAGAFSQAMRAALAAPPPAEEDDATIVAPKARPAPRPAPPVEAKAKSPEAAAKKGPPVALLGGAGVVLLAAAAGAFFVLRSPTAPAPVLTPEKAPVAAPIPSPTPPVPPAPVQPKPEPVYDPVAAQVSLAKVLAQADCSALALSAQQGPGFVVHGLVGEGAPRKAVLEAAQAALGSVPVAWHGEVVPQTYCKILDAIRLANSGPSGAPIDSPAITMAGHTGSIDLVDRSPIAPTITMPDFPAWLTVDYLSNDGSFAHLYPGLGKGLRLHKPGLVVALSGKESGGVGPPFGRDLVIAAASSERLFPTPRPADEKLAGYADALFNAVQSAKSRGQHVTLSAIIVDTRAK